MLARGAADVLDQPLRRRLRTHGFLPHLNPFAGYDGPKILHSSSHAFCPIGAGVGQAETIELKEIKVRSDGLGLRQPGLRSRGAKR